ncbi:PKD domain-containing protein [Microbacterium insulae]|uniref:PKD domain-containing protein n=1 Tax=Microbacterium insulae TaxID=483014 RepID=A0ABW3AGQ8_9MICO
MHHAVSTTSTRPRGRAAAVLAAAALIAAGLVAVAADPAAAAPGPAPIEQRNAQTVTADPLPTVQIDSGIVWTQVVNGTTVYAGGSFSNARPAGANPGQNLMPRSNLLAYNITTGVATSFAPTINGTVKALAVSPDGSRLYVGGSFNQVNGQTRWNFAVFNTSTGALIDTVKPAIGGSYVNAIVATSSTVYIGGLIGAAQGVTRKNLAAVNASNGAVLGWAPTPDLQVDTMVMAPGGGKLIVGGRFEKINGTTSRGLGALDLTTGALLPWAVTNVVKNGMATGSLAGRAGIWALSADSSKVYGAGWVFSNATIGNLEGLFAADGQTGAVSWIADCHGDHYGVFSDGTNVYSTGHEHDCQTAGGMPQAYPSPGNMRNSSVYTAAAKGTLTRSPYVNSIYADWTGYPAPAAVNWYPDWTTGTASGSGQAAWTVTGNSQYVVFGGEFPLVNGQRNQGLARFARTPSTGANQGPRLSGANWTPTARSVSAGTAHVRIPANWDRDDLDLTYELWAQGGASPIATKAVKSTYWFTPVVTFAAEGIPAGSSRTYRVIARDGDGNSATSANVTVTVGGTSTSSYADTVLDDGATTYWRLGPSGGGTDLAGSNNLVSFGGVGTTSDDGLAGEANGSSTFNGSTSGFARSTDTTVVEEAFAVELWFKTSTTSGGKLIGYGNGSSGNSGSYDRHLYMRNDGALVFGVSPGYQKVIASPGTYRDNQWHHAVAQLNPWTGIQLYVDGTLVASDPSATAGQLFTGFWRIGGDNLNGWPNRPSSNFFNGSLDEVAIYPHVLSGAQIAQHYALGRGQSLPTASFTTSGSNLSWSFNGSGSSAPSGRTITSYAWNFGDGSNGSGVNASRTYASPGTYTVTLTVTDSAGMTASTTRTVNASGPHQAPVAVIGASASGLTVNFTGSGSTASGGATVTGYAWNFGDGTTSTQANPVKTYAVPGTYVVTLTVTDSMGSTSPPASQSVTVSAQTFVAQDAFTRSVSGGWGSATVGGAWTVNSAASFSVNGSAGLISMNAGQTRSATLAGTSAQDVDARALFSTDVVANGGGVHFNYQVHKTAAGEYRLKLRISSAGAVTVSIAKVVGTTETLLVNRSLGGYTHTAGGKLRLHLVTATAGGTTTLTANVWPDGSAEPGGWFVSATDAQAELQAAGQIGVLAYLSGSTTNAPVIVSVDDVEVR